MSARLKRVFLKPQREKSVLHRHPWVFSGSVGTVDDGIDDGEIVTVLDHRGNMLGTGYFNSSSRIRVRMLSFGDIQVSREFFAGLVLSALRRRQSDHHLLDTNACRLINGEGDNLPGLIADHYNGHLVVQVLTRGIEKMKEALFELLIEICKPVSVYERSDHPGRKLEGLGPVTGQIYGVTPGDIIICEEGMEFSVDVYQGQKTGFFLDQRENRRMIRELAGGKKVLNLFSYTGGFTVAALLGGAVEVTSVDASADAIDLARQNAERNSGGKGLHKYVVDDVFSYLRNHSIDSNLVIIDPPALAKSRDMVDRAARGYKDLTLQVALRCPPDSLILSCSCSRYIDMGFFQKIIYSAFSDAGRNAVILKKNHHPSDHPVNLYCPESEYLKALLIHID